MKSSNAFCELDLVPTWLVKTCRVEEIKVSRNIVNISLKAGVFPQSMKAALLKPLIKKPNLDCNILSNYRPVSNLSFLSKIIERTVASQLNKYLLVKNLNETQQSAFKCGHSIETALLRVKNNIMMLVDKNKAVVLVLLHLSTEFDTVDHDGLFSRQENLVYVLFKGT